jgi:TolB-like protein
MNGSTLTFGGARLDGKRRVVTDAGGRETVLRVKSFDVLEMLLDRPDEVVTKDQLFERIWNGVAVSEDTLVQCITEIRKAIGEKGHEALKTVTKVGYRLVPDALPAAAIPLVSAPIKTIHPRGIAVLPFANLSTDPDQDFLADGLAEDVITDLSRSAELFVIAKNSSFSFKGKEQDPAFVASELGVRYLVGGSLRKSGDRLRITAHLIDTQSNGTQVWAERYESAYKDVFDIQDEISQQVTKAVVGRLTTPLVPRQRPASMEVFELSLQGRGGWFRSKSEMIETIAKWIRARELDPGYARIHAQLGWVHLWQWVIWVVPGNEHLDLALQYTGRGVALDHNDSLVRLVHATALLHCQRWEEAESEFATALALDPNGADVFAIKAYMLAFAGQGLAGLECMKQALSLNPRPPEWYYWYAAICQNSLGRFDEAIATLRERGFAGGAARRTLIYSLAQSGEVEEAGKEVAIYLTEDPTFRTRPWLERIPYRDPERRERHIRALVEAGLPE